MKILVTGSCGFIASNFIRKVIFNKLDHSICSIDKIPEINILNNIYQNKSHSFYIGNVLDTHLLNIIFSHEKPDVVIHCAAETNIMDSNISLAKYMDDNVNGTQKILESCVKHGVKKIIYLSSMEVYGSNNPSDPSVEKSILNPENPYALSKTLSEQIVSYYGKYNNVNYNIIRLGSVMGPREFGNKFIPNLIDSMLKSDKPVLSKDGNNIKNWLHVADVVNGILNVLENGTNNEIYNLCSSKDTTDLEIFQTLASMCNFSQENVDFDGEDKRFYRVCTGSNAKIKKIGWQQDIDLYNGLLMTFDWYKNNPWWFKS